MHCCRCYQFEMELDIDLFNVSKGQYPGVVLFAVMKCSELIYMWPKLAE